MPASNAVAIFAIDPGGTTGCATGLYDISQPTVAACMKRARSKGLIEVWTVTGSPVEQAWMLAREVVDFFFKVRIERGLIEVSNCFLVRESFQLRQMAAELSPVEISAGMETLLYGPANLSLLNSHPDFYQKQTASEAKGFCSDNMLKKWGLFKGLATHERDALRHTSRRLDKLLGG